MAKAVLFFVALSVAPIAIGYMISPATMFGLYDIDVTSVNELNMVRAAYGGILGGFGVLFLFGALKDEFRRPALIALVALMAGAGVARVVSIVVDGVPSALVNGLLAVEVVTTVLALFALRRLPT